MRELLRIFLFTTFILPLTTGAYAVGENSPCNTTTLKCDATLYCNTETVNICLKCANSQYSAAGATSCSDCTYPSGATANTNNSTAVDGVIQPTGPGPVGTENCPWEVTCPAGQRWAGISCAICTGNTFSPGGKITSQGTSQNPQNCTSCGINSQPTGNNSGCTCYNGYSVNGGTDTNTAANGAACKPRTFTLTYKPNGGNETDLNDYIDYNIEFTARPSTTFSRTGYSFSYWAAPSNKRPNLGIPNYATGGKYIYNNPDNTELLAQWTGNNFEIKYDANGANGSAPTSPTSCTYGSTTCKAPANSYTYSGHVFTGWKCTSGECNGTTFKQGDDLSKATTTDGAEITLTAQWGSCPVGFYCSGGQQKECAGGKTSDGGKSSEADCYIKKGTTGTKFCDGAGNCFYLPNNVGY